MTVEQLKKLSKMKKLVRCGNYRFVHRKNRDYLQDLLDIGISEEMAWKEVLLLNAHDYVLDYKPIYDKKGDDALTFKRVVNGNLVYIKIKLEEYNKVEETVCLSFHIDHK